MESLINKILKEKIHLQNVQIQNISKYHGRSNEEISGEEPLSVCEN